MSKKNSLTKEQIIDELKKETELVEYHANEVKELVNML
jgi:hypothetical protein